MRPIWVTRAIDQLIRQFATDVAWIGIASRDIFAPVGFSIPRRTGGRIEVSPDIAVQDGFVWLPDAVQVGTAQEGTVQAGPELWLSPAKTGYRPAYDRFARRYLGASGLEGADVQIDHVFPKGAGAIGGLAYMRMLAIPPGSNMAAGRTLEKQMVERNRSLGPRAKQTRLATYYSIGKATGFTGYERLPDDEDSTPNHDLSAALLAHLRAFGVPGSILTSLDRRLTAHTASRLR
jgi:hypothetical protein